MMDSRFRMNDTPKYAYSWCLFSGMVNSIAEGSEIIMPYKPDITSFFEMSIGGNYEAPRGGEIDLAEALFTRMAKGDAGNELASAWSSLGLNLVQAQHNGSHFIVLMEDANQKRGRGLYIFRPIADQKRYLVIPHRYTDEDTGDIGLQFFLEGTFSLAAWNTARRYPKGEPSNETCDLARLPRTYLTALTRAMAQIFPEAYQIQIHGFERAKRKSQAGKSADIIISAADNNPRQEILDLGRRLSDGHFGSVRIYPLNINELGGTVNICGQLLRTMGRKTFVHIELSHEIRQQLKTDQNLRKTFVRRLEETLH